MPANEIMSAGEEKMKKTISETKKNSLISAQAEQIL